MEKTRGVLSHLRKHMLPVILIIDQTIPIEVECRSAAFRGKLSTTNNTRLHTPAQTYMMIYEVRWFFIFFFYWRQFNLILCGCGKGRHRLRAPTTLITFSILQLLNDFLGWIFSFDCLLKIVNDDGVRYVGVVQQLTGANDGWRFQEQIHWTAICVPHWGVYLTKNGTFVQKLYEKLKKSTRFILNLMRIITYFPYYIFT